MICTASSRFDIARFGAEVFRGSPRQADLMIVSGTVTKTMMPMIARLYDQMPEPKYVISMGACATGGGPFKEGYNVVSGIDKYLPVDVYIPGCPPTPQALLNGLIMLQKKIDGEKLPIPLLGKQGIRAVVRRRGRARHPGPGARPRPDRPPDGRDHGRADGAWACSDQHEAELPKPAKIPAPQPEPEAEPAPAAAAGGRRRQGPEQDRPDPRQGARRGASGGRRPTGPMPAAAGQAPAPAAKPGKKAKRAEARPSLVWLGDAEAQGAGRPAQRRVRRRAPSRSSRPACWSSPTSSSRSRSSSATRTRSSTTTSPASRASTTRTASRSTTSSTARRPRAA